ncbi:hypothetical protein ZHAS_00007924 [Anopheles sinensis]|uniref:Uncharacterized protein n=1 Tax=Anopheles sinensis TaxID=74873 RepID=A0A084VR51_ANOSI|nr:hypothetical protein ZHAS_00007924 [Anopheles sinensis]
MITIDRTGRSHRLGALRTQVSGGCFGATAYKARDCADTINAGHLSWCGTSSRDRSGKGHTGRDSIDERAGSDVPQEVLIPIGSTGVYYISGPVVCILKRG